MKKLVKIINELELIAAESTDAETILKLEKVIMKH